MEEGTPPLLAELSALKPRALKKRAAELGVDEEAIDEADDADDVKGTLIALILDKEKKNAEAARAQALRDELETMKPRALKKRARELAVDEEKIDEADDADDVKGTLVALIIAQVAANAASGNVAAAETASAAAAAAAAEAAAALAQELDALKPRALKKRATEDGVDEQKIDEADDADDVKATLIALIMEKAGFGSASTVSDTDDGALIKVPYGTVAHHGQSASRKQLDDLHELFGQKHVILSYQWDVSLGPLHNLTRWR